MGSDLYMESRSFRPRPTKIEWVDKDTIRVERDYFYDGYRVDYEGPVNPQTEPVIRALAGPIPKKPRNINRPQVGEEVSVTFTGVVTHSTADVVTISVKVNGSTDVIVPRVLVNRKKK